MKEHSKKRKHAEIRKMQEMKKAQDGSWGSFMLNNNT